MNINDVLALMAIGLTAGLIAGGMGVGGAIILVPSLVFFFKMSQHEAQGTSLGVLLLPVMALAVMNYYKAGYVNFRYVFIIAIAFVGGTYLGSKLTMHIPTQTLKKMFALLLILVGAKMFFGK